MSFVQKEIQNIVQDCVRDGRMSSIPDPCQLKAGSARNQPTTTNALRVPKWP